MIKSLGCRVVQVKRKLKAEFRSLLGEEIRRITEEKGKAFTTEEVRTPLLSYSGDTPVTDPQRWNHSNILIHEATFLRHKEGVKEKKHGNKHSTLEEVMEMVSGLSIRTLVLSHFSPRYSDEEIDRQVRSLCEKYAIPFPVYRILPGQICRDLLAIPPFYG